MPSLDALDSTKPNTFGLFSKYQQLAVAHTGISIVEAPYKPILRELNSPGVSCHIKDFLAFGCASRFCLLYPAEVPLSSFRPISNSSLIPEQSRKFSLVLFFASGMTISILRASISDKESMQPYFIYGSSQTGSGIPPKRHSLYVCLKVGNFDLKRPMLQQPLHNDQL